MKQNVTTCLHSKFQKAKKYRRRRYDVSQGIYVMLQLCALNHNCIFGACRCQESPALCQHVFSLHVGPVELILQDNSILSLKYQTQQATQQHAASL